MRFTTAIVATLLAVAQTALTAPTPADDMSARALTSQLYGCTGRSFTGTCEYTGLGSNGVCYITTGMFRNNLISVRSLYAPGVWMYSNDDCTGNALWVDTAGWGNIGAAMYKSYRAP